MRLRLRITIRLLGYSIALVGVAVAIMGVMSWYELHLEKASIGVIEEVGGRVDVAPVVPDAVPDFLTTKLGGLFERAYNASFKDAQVDGQCMHALAKLPYLKSLRFVNCSLSMEAVEMLPQLDRLTLLSIQKSNVPDIAFDHVTECLGLLVLELDGAEVTDNSGSKLKKLRRLTELSLSKSKIGEKTIETIGQLHTLKLLSLDKTEIPDTSFVYLSNLKHLEVLSLASTGVSDRSLEFVNRMVALRDLDLSHCSLTIGGVRKLAVCPRLTNLKIDARINEQYIDCIIFAHFPQLAQLILVDAKAPQSEHDECIEKLPNVKFIGILTQWMIDSQSRRCATGFASEFWIP